MTASNPNILTPFSRIYFRMFSLCKPLSDCGVDNPGTAVHARNLCTAACYSDNHRVQHGVVLDLQHEINMCKCKHRSSRKILKRLPCGVHKMNHVRVEPNYQMDGSVSSTGSQTDRVGIPELRRIWDTLCPIGPDTENEQLPEKKRRSLENIYVFFVSLFDSLLISFNPLNTRWTRSGSRGLVLGPLKIYPSLG